MSKDVQCRVILMNCECGNISISNDLKKVLALEKTAENMTIIWYILTIRLNDLCTLSRLNIDLLYYFYIK